MKDILKFYLDAYKKYNTSSSKQDMLATINSISNSIPDNTSSALTSIEIAKKALTDSNSNKDEIVQAVESVISSINEKYVVVMENKFSDPMSKDDAIKSVKEYDKKGVTGYIVSEEEAKRIKKPENFNTPKWN